MPINAEIPLQVKVPQVDTSGVVNALAHGRQMQMEQQRLQMQQTAANEQTQLHNLTIQDHQREVDDESNKTKAYNDAGGDLNKYLTLAGQYGVSAKGLQGIQKGITDHQKEMLGMEKEKRDLAESTAKAVGNSSQSLLSLPDEQTRAANWSNVRGSLIQRGFAKPEDIPEQYPGEQFLVDHRNLSVSAVQQIDNVRKAEEAKRQQGEFDIKAQEAKLKQEAAAREQLSRENPNDPALLAAALDAKGRAEIAHQKIQEAEAARQHAATNANEQKRIGLEGARLGLERKKFDATFGQGLDANGQPLPPDAVKARAESNPVAKAIAEYRMAPTPGQLRGGASSPIMRDVMALNPSYDATTYPARNKTASAYSPAGTEGQALKATDTALAHLGTLTEAGKALKNGDIKVINQIANSLGVQTGASAKVTYDAILEMVAPEISKAVVGGVGGEGERRAMAHQFDSSLSQDVREKSIAATASLLGARMEKSKHAYEQQMGRPLSWQPSDESKKLLDKFKSNAPGAGDGAKVYTQADVDAAVKAHPGASAHGIEETFKSKGWTKQ